VDRAAHPGPAPLGHHGRAGPDNHLTEMAVIGPDGEFGIDAYRWTPLYAGTNGWMESLALADRAGRWARTVTRIKGKDVESLDLHGYEPALEVQGLTDAWWRGKDSAHRSVPRRGTWP